MKLVLFIVCLIFNSNGFLLQNNTVGSAVSDQHYYYLKGLLTEEREKAQKMEDVILNLNEKMSSVINKTNMLTDSMANVQNENSVLKNELGQVKQDLNQLQTDYSALNKRNEILQNAMYVCNNATMKLDAELDAFTHSFPVEVLNNITEVQSNVEFLEQKLDKTTTKLDMLASTSNAHRQDFLAFLNQTRDTQHKMTTLETENKQHLQKLQSNTNKQITNLETNWQTYQNITNQKLTNLETKTNKSLQSYQNKTNLMINDISHSITSINQTVALTSCGGGSVTAGSVIKFDYYNKTVYGISDSSAFRNSGKFTCEFPGVYLFSVFIMSDSSESVYEMYKNNDLISYVYIVSGKNGGNNYHTGTGVVAVSLDVRDTLYVKSVHSMKIYSDTSCMTVIKIR